MVVVPGSSVCSWPAALTTLPPSSCLQTGVFIIHGSAIMSSSVARCLGLIWSILPIIVLVSLGRRRSNRQGPLITSCFGASIRGPGLSASPDLSPCCSCGAELRRSSAKAGVSSIADFERSLTVASAYGVPGVGGEMKSLYELSVTRGAFHGNLRSDMQAKIMAKDQTSVGCGSYLGWS